MSEQINTLEYFSPNLRDDELFKFFSTILDKGLRDFYYPDVEAMTSLYYPGSDAYNSEYMVKTLGGENLAALISLLQDKKSISVMLPGLHSLKGTQEGVETILKLIKLDYQNIIYLRSRTGCTKVTIVLKDQATASIDDLKTLERLAEEIFPVCLTLDGITNCSAIKKEMLNTGDKWVGSVGSHSLSTDIRLDRSILGRSQGATPPGSNVSVLLCSTDAIEIVVSENNDLPRLVNVDTSVAISHLNALWDDIILSRTLTLSRSDPKSRIGVTSISGRLNSDDLDLSTGSEISSKSSSYCYGLFIPGFSIMGRDANRLSHNASIRVTDIGLGEGRLSGGLSLSRGITTSLKVCKVTDRNWTEDILIPVQTQDLNVTEILTKTTAEDIIADQQYSELYYNSDYSINGIFGPSAAVASSVETLFTLADTFFSSISMSGSAYSTNVADSAYNTQIDVLEISEARNVPGLFSQFFYDELDYKV
jgi:hypothetical protein